MPGGNEDKIWRDCEMVAHFSMYVYEITKGKGYI